MCINIHLDNYFYHLYVLYNDLYLYLILSEVLVFSSFTLLVSILLDVSNFLYCFWQSQCTRHPVCFPRHMIGLVVPTGMKAAKVLKMPTPLSCPNE